MFKKNYRRRSGKINYKKIIFIIILLLVWVASYNYISGDDPKLIKQQLKIEIAK